MSCHHLLEVPLFKLRHRLRYHRHQPLQVTMMWEKYQLRSKKMTKKSYLRRMQFVDLRLNRRGQFRIVRPLIRCLTEFHLKLLPLLRSPLVPLDLGINLGAPHGHPFGHPCSSNLPLPQASLRQHLSSHLHHKFKIPFVLQALSARLPHLLLILDDNPLYRLL